MEHTVSCLMHWVYEFTEKNSSVQATTVVLHIHSVNMCPFREPGRFCLQKFFVCNGFTVSRPLLALMRLKSNLTCSLQLYNFDPGVVSSCWAASTSVLHKSNTFKISNFELLVHFAYICLLTHIAPSSQVCLVRQRYSWEEEHHYIAMGSSCNVSATPELVSATPDLRWDKTVVIIDTGRLRQACGHTDSTYCTSRHLAKLRHCKMDSACHHHSLDMVDQGGMWDMVGSHSHQYRR